MAADGRRVQEVVRKRYWREADAQVVVAAWLRSGEGLASFARGHGLRPARVGRWAARLGRELSSPVPFYPVRLVGAAEVVRPQASDPIEIVLVGDLRVRVPVGFAADDLRRVLEVLGEIRAC